MWVPPAVTILFMAHISHYNEMFTYRIIRCQGEGDIHCKKEKEEKTKRLSAGKLNS